MNYLDEVKAHHWLYLWKTLNSEIICTYPSPWPAAPHLGLTLPTDGGWGWTHSSLPARQSLR